MGIAAGGQITQKIYPDYNDVAVYDTSLCARVFINICNSRSWTTITGLEMPSTPIDIWAYQRAGIPWFNLYDEPKGHVNQSDALARCKDIYEIGNDDADLADGFDAMSSNVVSLKHKNLMNGAGKWQVYLSDQKKWADYPANISKTLESGKTARYSRGGQTYTVNPTTLKQVNHKYKTERKIRRKSTSGKTKTNNSKSSKSSKEMKAVTSAHASNPALGKWQVYLSDQKKWSTYPGDVCQKLDAGQTVTYSRGSHTYKVYPSQLKQINSQYHTERKIRKVAPKVTAKAIPSQPKASKMVPKDLSKSTPKKPKKCSSCEGRGHLNDSWFGNHTKCTKCS